MSNVSKNSAKRKLTEDDGGTENQKLDKSMHLLRMCDEFDNDEVDADEEHNERKGKHLESLRKEISEWKKLVASTPELSGSRTTESVQDIFKNFERILTEEQLHYIRSAVDYNKWLTESNEFRKRIAYYLEKRKYNSMSNDAEEDILNRIEAAATTDFVDHFAFSHLPE